MKGARSKQCGLTFLEDLCPVDPDQAGVGIFVFLAVIHVGQLDNKLRREEERGGRRGSVGQY